MATLLLRFTRVDQEWLKSKNTASKTKYDQE